MELEIFGKFKEFRENHTFEIEFWHFTKLLIRSFVYFIMYNIVSYSTILVYNMSEFEPMNLRLQIGGQ